MTVTPRRIRQLTDEANHPRIRAVVILSEAKDPFHPAQATFVKNPRIAPRVVILSEAKNPGICPGKCENPSSVSQWAAP